MAGPEITKTLKDIIENAARAGSTVLIFTLIFKILPDAKFKGKDVFVGTVVTTLLLLIGQ